MTAVWVILWAAPFAISGAVVKWLPPFLDRRYMTGRGPQRKSKVLFGSLVPSQRELPGRPSAAGTARRVYEITTLPAARRGPGQRKGKPS